MTNRLPTTTTNLLIVAVVAAAFGVLAGSVVTLALSRGSGKDKPLVRSASLDVNATVFEKFGMVFAERAVTKRYKADYEETLATYLLGSLSDLPLIRAYERNGLFAAEKLSGLRSDSQQIEQQLRETEAIFQVIMVFANTGDEATSITKVEFAFPTSRGDPWVVTFGDQALPIEGNSTKAKVYSIQIPLFIVLAERLKKAAGSLGAKGDEFMLSSEDEREQLVAQAKTKFDSHPFVNLRGKVQITVYDQKEREFRSEADFSKVLAFLETLTPPEFKKQREAKDNAKSDPKAKIAPKLTPGRGEGGRSN